MASEGMSPADYAAITGNTRNGGFGDGSGFEWIVILFLFAMFGGWDGNRGGFGGGSGGSEYGLYPWLINSNQINDGFRDQMMNDNINSIRDGVYGLSNQLCSFSGDMQMALASGLQELKLVLILVKWLIYKQL